MKQELEDLLCERYPKIFAERHKADTLMSWGFACGDGWFDLVNALCEQLQFATDRNGAPQVLASQVKEKFGTLSFYWRGRINDEQRGMISMAMGLSGRICEQCGKPGQVLVHKHVHMTRCPEHAPCGAESEAEYLSHDVPGIAP